MSAKYVSKILTCCMMIAGLAGMQAMTAATAFAGDDQQTQDDQQTKTVNLLPLGPPVNIAIGGGALLPKGMVVTAFNGGYLDKSDIVNGSAGRTLTQQVYVLKFRYGLTNRLELQFVPGYVNIQRDAYGKLGSDTLDGPSDAALTAAYALFSQRLGDPLSVAITAGPYLPTGENGAHRLPGADVWSLNAKLGISKVWNKKHSLDVEFSIVQPTEEGNQGVRKHTSELINLNYHYVLNETWNVGLEATFDHTLSSERYGVDMNNGYTELYAGPAVNYMIPKVNMWLGLGVYFPVVRDYDIATASDDVRVNFKIGKVFSL